MSFSDTPSGQIMIKSARLPMRAAKYAKDDAKDLAVAIGTIIVRHPMKCVAFLILEGYIHGLVFHHLKEIREFSEIFHIF